MKSGIVSRRMIGRRLGSYGETQLAVGGEDMDVVAVFVAIVVVVVAGILIGRITSQMAAVVVVVLEISIGWTVSQRRGQFVFLMLMGPTMPVEYRMSWLTKPLQTLNQCTRSLGSHQSTFIIDLFLW